ncbi:MAG: peptidoglycan-binding protein [Lewinellaceae bacterium]|nr:peptidoglycan-binding protein [Lewinellaceae bacterium]
MELHQAFSQLLEAADTASTLKKGARGAHIATLQHMLYQMGFGAELRWQDFGADGDYGGATTAAVQAFAARNGLEADGQSVSGEVGPLILQRFLLLSPMKRLHKAIREGNLAEAFPLDGREENSLEPMLEALGVAADGETPALHAFARQHGLPFDGGRLDEPLARKLLGELAVRYGDALPALLSAVDAATGLTIENQERTIITGYTVRRGSLEATFKVKGSYGGFYDYGSQAPAGFIERHWDEFFGSSGLSDSARKAILAVSRNEGKLDAINTWDGAFLSFGMFQWTLGTGSGVPEGMGELPALLLKVKQQQPEAFREYFGQFGIDIFEQRTNSTYGFITLNGSVVGTHAAKEPFRRPEWGFRFWHAGQDPRIQAVEIDHALGRLNNFYWKEREELGGHTLAQLINSEYGVALLLDQNVNRGNDVYSTVGEALGGFDLDNIGSWTDEDEQLLIEKYLEQRARTKMHDPEGRAGRIREMAGEGENLLSERRNTFALLKGRTRGIFSESVAPPPPPGYREEDYPDVVGV